MNHIQHDMLTHTVPFRFIYTKHTEQLTTEAMRSLYPITNPTKMVNMECIILHQIWIERYSEYAVCFIFFLLSMLVAKHAITLKLSMPVLGVKH